MIRQPPRSTQSRSSAASDVYKRQGIGWTAPWLLVVLAALPILWLILRAIPPAPIRRRFPGVALLLGLTDDEQVTDRTPWWLLLLRMLAVAGMILGLAGPVLNPESERTQGNGPLVIAIDASWAGAAIWPRIRDAIAVELDQAAAQDRPVALVSLTCLLYTSPSPRDQRGSRMPSSA